MAEREVEVVVEMGKSQVVAGRLFGHQRRNAESQTFRYSRDYIALPYAYALDPQLPLVEGPLHTPVGRSTFGAFSDCAPDRWGRRLIARGERQRVEREGGTARSFGEMDYLLGVRDDLRQGALRFRDPVTRAFLSDETAAVPTLVELSTLLTAAERMERDRASEEELATLLRGGSSLGGARPKAHVIDASNSVAIAKFPSPSADEWDVMRWEAVALSLAEAAGIRVPPNQLHVIDGKPVLVVDRFDRFDATRVGYVSAMTMLERADGEQGSYLEIAEVIARESPSAARDLRELWRRIGLSILISNYDDHLRNHGFLRTSSSGWSLSPAFDLNPDPRPGARRLHTAIDLDNFDARIDLLMEVAPEFRLGENEARAALRELVGATGRWRSAATEVGLDKAEVDRMAPAFDHGEFERALELAG